MSNIKINDIAAHDLFKALSNPHRLHVFLKLREHCCVPAKLCHNDETECLCVGELGKSLNIAPSTLSHHLKELHRAGLIQMNRSGKTVECSVDPAVLEQLADFFQSPACSKP